MKNQADLQKRFHQQTDWVRYFNRLANPCIALREIALAKRIVRYVPVREYPLRILDAGAGEGAVLHYLRPHFPMDTLIPIDFSLEKVSFLKHCMQEIHPVCGDVLHLPFADQSFDLVVMRDLLHHVNWNREAVVAEGWRVLRNGGVVVILESDGKKLLNRIFRLLYPAERGSADSSPDTMRRLGTRFGGGILEFVESSFLVRTLGFVLGWPSGWLGLPIRGCYKLAALWEAGCTRLLPRKRWMYMMLVLQKP